MTAIETFALTKRYGTKVAVGELSLKIEEGELFALLGLNGAGKTTTVKLLSCLLRPTSGDAFILGESIVKNPRAAKAHIGISPQETAVAQNLTVCENLALMAGVYRTPNAQVADLLETFGLTGVAKDRAKTLSGGMQRRLSIAMAVIARPKILFLDEPTLGLDVLSRRELWTLIKQLHGSVTIVLTTHYLEEAEALSDTVGVLQNGRLAARGSAEELMALADKDNFEDAFVALAQAKEAV